jgi:gas vesicle protein
MTQPPYVPPRDDDNTNSPDYTWPPAQETPVVEEKDSELFASQFPESTYSQESYVEPVSSVEVTTDYSSSQPSSTKDVAKDQASQVKDTAVQQGQQVAGVAKEQAGAVKDTALEQGQHVAGVAKEQAGAVKDTALEQGQHVAEVAKEQVTQVAAEASTHVKDLLSEGLTEVRSQASSQQKRLATGIHSLADELGTMASKSDKSGPLTDYAKDLSRRGGEAAHWLENAEPSEVLDSLRSFARRRPAVFLGAAALAGVIAGRVTRGAVANKKDEAQPAALESSYTPAATDYATPAYTTEDVTTTYAQTSPYSQDATPGTGYQSDYTTTTGESLPYGTTGNDGVAR